MKSLLHLIKHARFTPVEVSLLIPFAALLYILMEWLFIISKTSFISGSSFFEKASVLLNGSGILALTAILFSVPFIIFYYVLNAKTGRAVIRILLCLIPALLLSATVLLLVDNITYTTFKYGVVSTKGIVRTLYLVGFILLTIGLMYPIFKWARSISKSRRKLNANQKLHFPLTLGMIVLACILLPVAFNPYLKNPLSKSTAEISPKILPNIILFTGDALNSAKLSLYGYEKDTTPFLKQLAETSLVANNNFSNAQGTIGSTTSFLTGKYPTDTRTLASTDILKDADAYEHLPGILQSYGYYTVQLNFTYYADAYRINFQDAFIEANGESPVSNKIQSSLAKLLPTNNYFFMREVYSRISDRLEHLFYIKKMTNPFLQVTESPEKFNDQEKLDYLFKLFDEGKQPIFVHIHWMGTHGPKYYPTQQVFSEGLDPTTQGKFVESFYLDSILDFDNAVNQLYNGLSTRGLWESSVLVVGSDHTQRWSIARVPLLIHFPHDEHAGKVIENTQNMDIAPTLLNYLGIPQPSWMPGKTLYEPLALNRQIFLFAISDSSRDPETNAIVYPPFVAPFYQFGKATLISCDHYYTINFLKQTYSDAKVQGYSGTCKTPPPTREEAFKLISAHLENYGFNTTSLNSIKHDN
ncbi:MAG: sulfatase-like hydrolase/transferase [Anaerolineae bacterium]|nr:sulfatase-like hydrolase/transferase [Anaerolineae bacterium]